MVGYESTSQIARESGINDLEEDRGWVLIVMNPRS